ncbi:MAG: AAA family ATPase [Gemmatimonadaceae bacterium 4484_173]|nr:MAG: AAA family ATPase [Gemmatimonadaceae bacterium 4484_173]
MINRNAETTVKTLAEGYPVVIITGPRQSGKTTLARSVFPAMEYVSLENLDTRRSAIEDPRMFLDRFPRGAVLDEVQHCPDLLSYMQEKIDFSGTAGSWILTGSQQFGVLSEITQSLAGRAAYVELLPFSVSELKDENNLDKVLYSGLYPPVYDRNLDPGIWAGNYIRSYVERDVRRYINVKNLSVFQRFIGLCAARIGQLLNLSNIAADAGITHNTAREWISVLEASYIVFLLRPHHRNFRKRILKSPKLYFHDTGLASWLLSIETQKAMNLSPMRGPLFENLVISEILKARYNQGKQSNLYFWRDRAGHEVDLIVEDADRLIPIEIKSGQTVTTDYFKGINWWKNLTGEKESYLVYGGDSSYQRTGTSVISWRNDAGLERILR